MIVPIADLLAALAEQPKFYRHHTELGMRTFYNARAGRRLCAKTCEVLLHKARETRWPAATGLLLADGSTYYGSALLAEMAATIAEQGREIERLRRLVCRRVLTAANFNHGQS